MAVVAVPLVVVLGAVLLLAVIAWWQIVVVPWLEEAGGIAVIGRYIKSAGDAVERFILGLWTKYVQEPAEALAKWLHGTATQLVELPEQVVELAATVHHALTILRTQTVPALIDRATAPLERGIDAVDRLLDRTRSELAGFERGIEGRVRQLTEQLWDRAIGPVQRVQAELDRFAVGIDRRLDQLQEQLLERAVRPVQELAGNVIPQLRGRIGRVEDELEQVSPYVLGLAGAVTLAQAVEGIRAASRAKPKLDRMCVLDLDEMEDLVGLAFAGLSMAALVSIVREGQVLAEVHARLVDELIHE